MNEITCYNNGSGRVEFNWACVHMASLVLSAKAHFREKFLFTSKKFLVLGDFGSISPPP